MYLRLGIKSASPGFNQKFLISLSHSNVQVPIKVVTRDREIAGVVSDTNRDRHTLTCGIDPFPISIYMYFNV